MNLERRARLLLFLPALVALLLAMWGGLVRIGWQLEPIQPASHGPLMVSGFLGTLICLERAVAMAEQPGGRRLYLAPVFTGLGALALVFGLPAVAGRLLLALGSLGLVWICGRMVRQQPALHSAVMLVGAMSWWVGNLLWLGAYPVYQAAFWWVAFLVLTIAGERLELSRVMRHTRASQRYFALAVTVLLIGLALTVFNYAAGVRLAGIGHIGIALWLLRYDVTRRTVRQSGLTRFIAICLLLGYVWLATGGGLAIWLGGNAGGPYYDVMLHTILLGFVISMIFGHAPLIVPALTGLQIPYARRFYLHLALLHLSLLLRVIGDIALQPDVRRWGGLLNVVAILLFMASTALAAYRGRS